MWSSTAANRSSPDGARLRRAAEELTKALRGVCALDFRIHTNGATLDERFCRAVRLLNRLRYRHFFAGILCTIDVRSDPVAVYALAELAPSATSRARRTRAGCWPCTTDGPRTAAPRTYGIFDSVLSTLHGGDSLIESLGLAPSVLAVIETDGTFEQADSLKTAYEGASVTGMHVFTHTLDGSCPVVGSCGGGLYAHRYRSGSGFDNSSVYCADFKRLEERTGKWRLYWLLLFDNVEPCRPWLTFCRCVSSLRWSPTPASLFSTTVTTAVRHTAFGEEHPLTLSAPINRAANLRALGGS